ncbi:sodium channel protein type 4 subunit alpha B-like isoform 2-T2 [Odontesthes bonariensis]
MLTILINCVFMMISVPVLSRFMEDVFMAVYTFDFTLKILSRGFCVGRFTFLWDPWNWLDVLILTAGFAAQFTSLGKFLVLVTIPRVLKIFTCTPGLRRTVEALVQSVKRLADVIILTVVLLSILAMIGLHFFMGDLKHKCVIWPVNTTGSLDFYISYISDSGNYYYLPGHLDALLCGNRSDAGVCPEGTTCMRTPTNPNYGFTNYDSFGFSLLATFRLLMQDFWDNLVHLTLRAAGRSYITVFLLVFLPGCFFLLSIIVAAVAMAQVEREEADAAEAKTTEEEFGRIVQVLKMREEEEASRGAELPEEQDRPQKNPSLRRCMDTVLKKDCCGCWRRLRLQLRPFVLSPFFHLGVAACIILNAIFMAAEHYPMSKETEHLLTIANLVFVAIFTAELLLRLVALGLWGFFQVSRNVFDFVVVVTGLLELSLADIEGISVLRALRLLRLLRLERWWAELHLLMETAWTSVGNLGLVLLSAVFMFSVVGVQLFKDDYESRVCKIAVDCELPRWHMADFFHSFLLVVRILCGEWVETLWDCMEASGPATCAVFFMAVIIIGNVLMLNLFLSLLLGSFGSARLADPSEKGPNNLQTALTQTSAWILEHVGTLLGKKNDVDLDHEAADRKKDGRKEYLALTLATPAQRGFEGNEEGENMVPCKAPAANIKFRTPEIEKEKDQQMSKLQDENPPRSPAEDCCCDSCYHCCAIQGVDASRGAGRFWSDLRRVCLLLVQHRVFEGFIVFIILLSSAALMFEDVHPEQRPVLQMFLDRLDQVFAFVFLVEMLLKWVAFGFKKYFSSFWCWLDFLILDASLISLTANILGWSTGPLRTLRALRTLRTLSRFKGIRVVLRSLRLGLPSLCRSLLVTAFIWLLFGLLGMDLFAGKFYFCFNETSEEYFALEEVSNKTECLTLQMLNFTEVRWRNAKFNFDNVGMSFLSLFIVSLSAGWMDLLYSGVDSKQIEDQPAYESNLYMHLYFLFFIVGGFFTWNLFIRIFVDALQRRQVGEKHVFMTAEQQKYSRAVAKKLFEKPDGATPRPQSCCQAWLYDLVTALPFEVFMAAMICVYMVVLMVETDDSSYKPFMVVMWFHNAAIFIFLTEFILKIIALRQHYFRSVLNIIDFAVLIGLIVGSFAENHFSTVYVFHPGLLAVLRLARVVSILRYIRYARKIRMLILAFVMSCPALLNIGLLLFLVVYTYSYVGMWAFAHVKREATVDDMFNFETFGSSMTIMMTVGPSSVWDGLLFPIMNTPPDCDPDIDCGSPMAGIVFFTSYILLHVLLVVHLFIAVVVESFRSRNPEDATPLSEEHLQMFHNTWSKFDPDGSQVIPYGELSDFCHALQEPLKIPKPNSIRLVLMDLPLLPGDQVRCLDVLCALTSQESDGSGDRYALKARLEGKFHINDISKVSREPISSTLRRKQEEVAAAVIQRAFRKNWQVGGVGRMPNRSEASCVPGSPGPGGASP